MGVDPSTWGTTYQMVGTEDLDGVQVYHVKAVADPQKLAESLTKAAERPEPAEASSAARAASSASSARASRRTRQQAEQLQQEPQGRHRGVLDRRRRPATCTRRSSAPPWTRPARRTCRASTGVTMKGAVTMSDFDQPVDGDAAGRREVVQGVHEPALRRHAGRQQRADASERGGGAGRAAGAGRRKGPGPPIRRPRPFVASGGAAAARVGGSAVPVEVACLGLLPGRASRRRCAGRAATC